MVIPKDETRSEMLAAWRVYVDALEKSLNSLDAQIKEASEMMHVCTAEWCEATEHYLDEIANALFSISEPRWSSSEDSQRIKTLKRRIYDIYADYRGVRKKVS